jgi:tetratricopeptide (TPR) repeat protein/sugar lactone lactonase YvrE
MKKSVFALLTLCSVTGAWAYDSVTAVKLISLVDKKAEPTVLRLDMDGQPWVLNKLNGGIQHISIEGKPVLSFMPVKKKDASFRSVSDFAFYKDGSLFVADPDSNKIFHLDKSGKVQGTIDVPSPSALAVSLDDAIAAGLPNEGLIRLLSIDGVALHDLFLPNKDSFKSITALAFSADGVLWVLDGKAGRLHRFSPQRKWLGSTDGLEEAGGLAVDSYGFAYVTLEKGQWKEIDANGKLTGTFGTKGKEPGKMNSPCGAAIINDSQLWICETKNNRLQLFSIKNQNKKIPLLIDPAVRIQVRRGPVWPIASSKVALPQKDGRALIFSTVKKPKIDWVSKDGKVSSSVSKKELAKIVDVTLDASGAIWILDAGQSQISRIADDGSIQKSVGQKGKQEGGLKDPEVLRVRSDGSFVVVDKGRSRIQVLSPDGLFLFTVGKNGSKTGEFKTVTGIAATDDWIAVADDSRKALIFYDRNGKFLSEMGNVEGKPDIWNQMADVAADQSGRFYVLDKGSARLRIFAADGKFLADLAASGEKLAAGVDKTIMLVSEKSVSSYTLDVVPLATDNLTAEDNAGDINVGWDKNVDSVAYRVYRATTSTSYSVYLTTPVNSFSDRDTVPGVLYRYGVRGVNQMGYEGNMAQSAPVKASRRRDVSLVSISNVTFKPIFTAAFKFYVKEPIGEIEVSNNSDLSYRNVKLSLALKKYTDYATEKIIPDLSPGQKLTVPVTLTFNNTVLELTEDTPVQVDIRLSYFEDNAEKVVSQNAPLSLYSRNAISWNEKARIASFITPKDAPVVEFSRQAIRAFLPQLKTTTVMKPLAKAMLFFESMKALNISYVQDPKTPFAEASKNPTILDYVQFPRETLRRRTGDCDDTTALLSSLLESIGVETALIDTPGHIFMMANIEENDPAVIGLPIERFVEYRNSYWIPIETTKLSAGFLDAWQTAATEVRRGKDNGTVDFVAFSQAGDKYAPVTLIENDPNQPAFPEAAVTATFPQMLAQLEAERYANRVKAIQEKMAQDPKDSNLKIQLGMIYVEGRNPTEAEALFKSLLQDESIGIQAAAQNNLGNIAYIKGDFEAAAKAYADAANLDPSDAGITINRARAAWKLKNNQDVEKFLAEARQHLPEWREYVTDFPAELVSK